MALVRFTKNFDYRPTRNSVIAYKAGQTLTVRRECADQAAAANKGVELKARRRRSAE